MGYLDFCVTLKYTFEVTFPSPAGILLLSYCMVLAASSRKGTLEERTISKKQHYLKKIVEVFTKGKYLFILTGVLDLCC